MYEYDNTIGHEGSPVYKLMLKRREKRRAERMKAGKKTRPVKENGESAQVSVITPPTASGTASPSCATTAQWTC